jgi:hypothetical protein
MGWKAIHDKYKKRYVRNFVVCEQRYEREFLVNLILEHFSRLSRQKVEEAIDSCCASIPIPRQRELFIECLKAKLTTGR